MQNPFEDWDEVYFSLCKGINTPKSLACWLAWKYRCFTSIASPRAADYDSVDGFSRDYLCYSWASKARVNLENLDLKAVALTSFKEDEAFNRETTFRLRNLSSAKNSRVEGIIHDAQRKIAHILGPLDLSSLLDNCRFGNGATVSLSRRRARYDKKMTTFPLTVSPSCVNLALAVIQADPLWGSAICRADVLGPFSILPSNFEVVDYNQFDTVPKSLKGDRTIAKEPVLNGFLQQSVHVYLVERLRRFGVDLKDQTVNQSWASLAEKLELATLDAKSASNSVTTELVKLLLPPDWFDFLNKIRSRKTRLPDGTIHYNWMFSSMGNAFTFELETMIFYSILSALCGPKSVVSVYGDDMILPQQYAAEAIQILELLGFRINRDKSFVSGAFFESCGKHYFKGSDVTPVFQKAQPRLNHAERIRSANRLLRWGLRMCYGLGIDSAVRPVWNLLSGNGNTTCPRGPVLHTDDDWFIMTPDIAVPALYGTARFTCVVPATRKELSRQRASYAYSMRLKSAKAKHSAPGPSTEPLELSCVSMEVGWTRRWKRISLSDIHVDATWF